MFEPLINYMSQNHTEAILISVFALFVFILSFRSNINKISSNNRGVSAGRDINGPVMTGDVNSNRKSILNTLANVSTILALIISALTLYVSYLALIK